MQGWGGGETFHPRRIACCPSRRAPKRPRIQTLTRVGDAPALPGAFSRLRINNQGSHAHQRGPLHLPQASPARSWRRSRPAGRAGGRASATTSWLAPPATTSTSERYLLAWYVMHMSIPAGRNRYRAFCALASSHPALGSAAPACRRAGAHGELAMPRPPMGAHGRRSYRYI